MLVACWSVKGGVGTSVVAAALSLGLARRHPEGCLVADLVGDQPAVLGLPDPPGPGLAGWAGAWPEVPDAGLARLEVPVVDGLALLPAGPPGPPSPAPALASLADALVCTPRAVVADLGRLGPEHPALAVAARATRSLLVVRPCYLGLRRAMDAPVAPTGVVVVDGGDRILDAGDVAAALDAPVVAIVPEVPAVARAVDSGVLAHRVPRALRRAVGGAA